MTMKTHSDLALEPQPTRGVHLDSSKIMPSTTTKLVCVFVAILFFSAARIHDSMGSSPLLYDNQRKLTNEIPPPPNPEPITVSRLPLPPVAPSSDVGSCNSTTNPRRTGCIAKTSGLQSGNYLPDNVHVLAVADFAGAPKAPDPASIYQGRQLIIIKANNEAFDNGDAWKCITCGVSQENSRSRGNDMDYPQAFTDGKRVLAGTNIVECPDGLVSEVCGPESARITPLRWDTTADGSGPGGSMRELRLHPDDVHIGFSSLFVTAKGVSQFSLFGRIRYNPSPTAGEPLAPRYDVVDVSILHHDQRSRAIVIDPEDPTQLIINPQSLAVGELRGFSGSGKEVTWIGYPVESCNMDVFAADLTDGAVRRLTSHPGYVDPVDISPDDKWSVVMDTRASERQMFLSGLRGVPPLIDLVVTAAVASVRNNGQRRFFTPWLIGQYGDRGSYIGQKINAAGSSVPGSGDINDPEWNGSADPKWSRDGTRIVYTEAITESPACGGKNPLPCYHSTEDGGRNERIMVAQLTDREPLDPPQAGARPDIIPWGTPFPPGSSFPEREGVPLGNYTLKGKVAGWADVSLSGDAEAGTISSVSVKYHGFSDDGLNVLVGSESVSKENPTPLVQHLHWFSDLRQTGPNNGTKITSPDGFHLSIDVYYNIFHAIGNLTTTVNGKEYLQPVNET